MLGILLPNFITLHALWWGWNENGPKDCQLWLINILALTFVFHNSVFCFLFLFLFFFLFFSYSHFKDGNLNVVMETYKFISITICTTTPSVIWLNLAQKHWSYQGLSKNVWFSKAVQGQAKFHGGSSTLRKLLQMYDFFKLISSNINTTITSSQIILISPLHVLVML